MSRDRKYEAPEFTLAVVCQGCGKELTEHNTACTACDRCDECMPGTCWECDDLRREDDWQRSLDYAAETGRVWVPWR